MSSSASTYRSAVQSVRTHLGLLLTGIHAEDRIPSMVDDLFTAIEFGGKGNTPGESEFEAAIHRLRERCPTTDTLIFPLLAARKQVLLPDQVRMLVKNFRPRASAERDPYARIGEAARIREHDLALWQHLLALDAEGECQTPAFAMKRAVCLAAGDRIEEAAALTSVTLGRLDAHSAITAIQSSISEAALVVGPKLNPRLSQPIFAPALPVLQKLRKEFETDSRLPVIVCRLMIALGFYDEAQDLLGAIRSCPLLPSNCVLQYWIYEQTDHAIRAARLQQSKHFDKAEEWLQYGLAMSLAGFPKQAVPALHRIETEYPDYMRPSPKNIDDRKWFWLALASAALGDRNRVEDYLGRWNSRLPSRKRYEDLIARFFVRD